MLQSTMTSNHSPSMWGQNLLPQRGSSQLQLLIKALIVENYIFILGVIYFNIYSELVGSQEHSACGSVCGDIILLKCITVLGFKPTTLWLQGQHPNQ